MNTYVVCLLRLTWKGGRTSLVLARPSISYMLLTVPFFGQRPRKWVKSGGVYIAYLGGRTETGSQRPSRKCLQENAMAMCSRRKHVFKVFRHTGRSVLEACMSCVYGYLSNYQSPFICINKRL